MLPLCVLLQITSEKQNAQKVLGAQRSCKPHMHRKFQARWGALRGHAEKTAFTFRKAVRCSDHSGQNSLTARCQSNCSKHMLMCSQGAPSKAETVMAFLQQSAHLSLCKTCLTGECRAHHCPRRILAVATSTAQIPIRTDLSFSPCWAPCSSWPGSALAICCSVMDSK